MLYGERWLSCVPYFQILCVSRLLGVMVPLNMNIISAKGQGRLYLITQLIKCVFSIIVILLSIHHGIYALLIALALIPLFEFIVCSTVNNNLIKYGLFQQIKDIIPTFLIALLLSVLTYYISYIVMWHPFIVMVIQVILYIGSYLLITKVMRFEAYYIFSDVLLKKLKKRS